MKSKELWDVLYYTNHNNEAVRVLVSQPITAYYVGHRRWQLLVAITCGGQWWPCVTIQRLINLWAVALTLYQGRSDLVDNFSYWIWWISESGAQITPWLFSVSITHSKWVTSVWAHESNSISISPSRLLVECYERRLDRGRFVLLYFAWFLSCIILHCCLTKVCQYQSSVWLWRRPPLCRVRH